MLKRTTSPGALRHSNRPSLPVSKRNVERAVAAPGLGRDRHAGHGLALPVDDLAAQRVPRPEAEFQRRLVLGVDLPQVGAKPSACTVTTDAPGLQFSSTNSPRASVFDWLRRLNMSPPRDVRAGDRLAPGIEHASLDREAPLQDGHGVEVCATAAPPPGGTGVPGSGTLTPTRSAGASSTRHRPWASVVASAR